MSIPMYLAPDDAPSFPSINSEQAPEIFSYETWSQESVFEADSSAPAQAPSEILPLNEIAIAGEQAAQDSHPPMVQSCLARPQIPLPMVQPVQ